MSTSVQSLSGGSAVVAVLQIYLRIPTRTLESIGYVTPDCQ